jgi:predicted transcriptional regulator
MCSKLHTEEESLKLKRLKRCLKYKSKGYKLSVSMNMLVPMITEDVIQYEKTIKDTVQK